MVTNLADLGKPKLNPNPVTEKLKTNPIYITYSCSKDIQLGSIRYP